MARSAQPLLSGVFVFGCLCCAHVLQGHSESSMGNFPLASLLSSKRADLPVRPCLRGRNRAQIR